MSTVIPDRLLSEQEAADFGPVCRDAKRLAMRRAILDPFHQSRAGKSATARATWKSGCAHAKQRIPAKPPPRLLPDDAGADMPQTPRPDKPILRITLPTCPNCGAKRFRAEHSERRESGAVVRHSRCAVCGTKGAHHRPIARRLFH